MMKPYQIMNEVARMSVIQKSDLFFWHNDSGIFNCSASAFCKNSDDEEEVFELLQKLPKPSRTYWRSYEPKDGVKGYTCITVEFGDFRNGGVEIRIFIDDIQ